MDIFNFFGSLLGYLLWTMYLLFRNYGVAIILFSIITKLIMFPFSVKQQRSMASQSKLSAKQSELQKKYGNNRAKYNEEVQKMYEKEGVNPASGCLTTLIPLPLMLGIIYSVTRPLSNTLHIAVENVNKAVDYIARVPGMGAIGIYPELEVMRNFDVLKDRLVQFFTAGEMEKMEIFSTGFNFLGLDLLSLPSQSSFASMMWIIPLLSLVLSFGTQFYMSKTNQNGMQAQQQQGCMKVMMYALPLISVYWSYSMPGASGFYWVMSSFTGLIQTIAIHKFFSVHHMTAKAEAQRAVSLELAEQNLKMLSAAEQLQIEAHLDAKENAQNNPNHRQNDGKKNSSSKKQNKKSGGKSAGQYRGSKK
jgi:membrane protein insertase, YidC/Oxa1 family, C-terminal domain